MEQDINNSNDLLLGKEGPLVEELHRMLSNAGFPVKNKTSIFSSDTQNSLRLFQESRRIEISGICDQRTWDALLESGYRLGDRLLYFGHPMLRGEDVSELQRAMGSLGFNPGKVDGIFGPDTQNAVELFQRNSGLVVDSIFGPNCLSALKKLGNRNEQQSVAILQERERIISKTQKGELPHIALGDLGGFLALLSESAKTLREAHITTDVIQHYDISEHAKHCNKHNVDLYIGLYPVQKQEKSISYYAAKGFESPGGASFTQFLANELTPLFNDKIDIHGRSEQILRETRMPAVILRIGPTEDLVRIAPQLSLALKEAILTWFSNPFEEEMP